MKTHVFHIGEPIEYDKDIIINGKRTFTPFKVEQQTKNVSFEQNTINTELLDIFSDYVTISKRITENYINSDDLSTDVDTVRKELNIYTTLAVRYIQELALVVDSDGDTIYPVTLLNKYIDNVYAINDYQQGLLIKEERFKREAMKKC